jgi:NADH-quinone oxidoreductase subunit C
MSEAKPDLLDEQAAAVAARFGDAVRRVESRCGELGFEVASAQLRAVCAALRDEPDFRYEQLVDLTGVDYLEFGKVEWNTSSATRSGFSRGVNRGAEAAESAGERRFVVVYHLQSVRLNRRLRLRVWCEPGEPPQLDSVIDLWSSADWYEREAFDLFGIVFRGHPDLRRLLTDYGFVGHPFRKDFPLVGNVEVRFDPGKGRVVYEPVSIEPRTLVPRVIRDDNRYEAALKDAPRRDASHG